MATAQSIFWVRARRGNSGSRETCQETVAKTGGRLGVASSEKGDREQKTEGGFVCWEGEEGLWLGGANSSVLGNWVSVYISRSIIDVK